MLRPSRHTHLRDANPMRFDPNTHTLCSSVPTQNIQKKESFFKKKKKLMPIEMALKLNAVKTTQKFVVCG